ncbi:MAG: lytic murein transglycosylase [Betaproteobacteria bacterium]|nr:lytic murein transglycosylase [Betaproteobacteria bacterium]
MKRRTFSALLIGAALLGSLPCAAAQEALEPGFVAWLGGVRDEALARGVSEHTWRTALPALRPIPRVLDLDAKQPEFVEIFWNYLDGRVNARRIDEGRKLMQRHAALLDKIARAHGVPPGILVAFWGMETDYGKFTGGYPVVGALATLAYDARRSRFFRAELLDALDILQAGHIQADAMRGSWAGAMGQVQFMPSTFRRYAVDADGDGRKNIWSSPADALASAAHYLREAGWRADRPWGEPVRLPAHFDWQLARLDGRRPLADWAELGVSRGDGSPLPKQDGMAAILLPQGHAGPAFLVHGNFDVMLTWNRSVNYALAVGHLADRLEGAAPLYLGRDTDNRRLTREQALELQQCLARLGFGSGEADGVLGSKTRAAIRAYQSANRLPADGYPSLPLLERLQTAIARPSQAASLLF